METFVWEETLASDNSSGGYSTIFFTPAVFGAPSACVIRKFSVKSAWGANTLPSVPVWAKIMPVDVESSDDIVSTESVSMTQIETFYEFNFASDVQLAKDGWYKIKFFDAAIGGNPVSTGVSVRVMDGPQAIYYASSGHGNWRPITKFTYLANPATAMTAAVWTEWGFAQLAQGPRGDVGPEGSWGEPGQLAGPTGPTGLNGPTGPRGRRGVDEQGPKGPTARMKYVEGESGSIQLLCPNERVFWRYTGYSETDDGYFTLEGSVEDPDRRPCNGITLTPVSGDTYALGGNVVLRENGLGHLYDVAMTGSLVWGENITNIGNFVLYNSTGWTGHSCHLGLRFENGEYHLFIDSYYITTPYWAGDCETYSPPILYITDRQVDETPILGDMRALVTSGGVAKAYCDLIDAIGTATALPAATIAQMKALYGA